jgi:Nif-specific regulatory protein
MTESYRSCSMTFPAEDSGLGLLYRISREVTAPEPELSRLIHASLSHLAAAGMERGTVAIYDPGTGEIAIESSHGLTPEQRERGRYRLGEGIVGQVFERGEPALIPRIGEEPLFLDRTGARRDLDWSDIAFVCVPIINRGERIGTLSVDCRHTSPEKLEDSFRLLSIVALIIGEVVRNWRDRHQEIESLRLEKQRLEEQCNAWRPDFMIGSSRELLEVFTQIRRVGPTNTTVLIQGESGTGKELVARAIHDASRRAAARFVSVNCAALPEQLVASELFGHVRGAYTGAEAARKGRFELADGGTLFLDEIGEISPAIQVKLLRVLQEGQIDRLGDESSRKVDVRVIAATNANLEAAMERGSFRSDLFYRLNVFPIYLPPLRERPSDITLLADHFLAKYAALHDRKVVRISTPAIELLTSYHWPGNVRELENCMARAVLVSDDGVIRAHHLPPTLQTGKSSGTTKHGSLEGMMMAYEREILIEALKNACGNKAAAARALATTPRIFSYRLRKHGLEPRL